MKKELEKVLENSKLKETFEIVKVEANITDLAKLLQKKKAQKIITMIRHWQYDQETN
ncbi:23949_t:CDS:1, partial [Gigaspora margarita]